MWFKGILVGAVAAVVSIIIFLQLLGGKHVQGGTSFDLRAVKSLAVSFFGGLGVGGVFAFVVVLVFAYRFGPTYSVSSR